jgi:molybdenum cofactor synthesis domain-containing protein
MKFNCPNDALMALSKELQLVATESLDTNHQGRILASTVTADRDSPAADVSAMDGYAIRMTQVQHEASLPIMGESAAGSPAPEMPSHGVLRIFTGAIVPQGCDAVVKREDTEELNSEIRLKLDPAEISKGQHIRRAGENASRNSTVLEPGIEIHGAHKATMANFGCSNIDTYQPIRVTILTTGDEVGTFHQKAPMPWQLRNSNRESIATLLAARNWISIISVEHCIDDQKQLHDTLADRLDTSDAILMTGGVSMGDYDYVPDVIRDLGGKVVFHGLPIRPGKPVLGAATNDGKLLLGLPGNPVSATIGCQRLGIPLLAYMAGKRDWLSKVPAVQLENRGNKSIPLTWLRLVKLVDNGVAEPVITQGSGDLVSLGNSDGFVEVPPQQNGEGPWPFYAW